MGIHLVTGYAGKEHITAADKGAYQAGIVGAGKYVLQSGNMFEAEIISNNLIKVKDGDLLNQGRHVHIAVNDYEECSIENGTQSMKRNDLIVVRYTRDTESGIETAQMLVLKGTPGATATDPSYITGNILHGDAVDDFLLYRVKLDGLSIVGVEPLFSTIAPYKDLVEKTALMEDYVVAKGKSGVWSYWKWASGLAICLSDLHNIANFPNAPWGSIYDSGLQFFKPGTYPFPFVEAPFCYAVRAYSEDATNGNYAWVIASGGSALESPGFMIARATQGDLYNIHMRCFAVGRWK